MVGFPLGGSAACCEHLLSAGADETLRTPRDWTALHLAALQGQVEAMATVEILWKLGGDGDG